MKLAGVAVRPEHAGIKVLDDFCEPLEERPMGFIEDEEVEETWAELCVAERQRLLGGNEEAFGLVDLDACKSGRAARAVSGL
jgi:hypothetical protein